MKRPHRIVCFGNWPQPTYFTLGVMEGSILNGAWFRPVPIQNSLTEIQEFLRFVKPDMILSHMIFGQPYHPYERMYEILKQIKREFGTRLIYHAGDARTEPRKPQPIDDLVDMALCNHNLLTEYENYWKVPCIHWPYGCLQQGVPAEKNNAFKRDWIFTGGTGNNKHHSHRAEIIQKLKHRKVDILVLPEDDKKIINTMYFTPEIASSAKAILGSQMGTTIPLYQDVRPFQYIGAGALYFHDRHPNMDFFFEPGKHYVPYERGNIDNLLQQWKHYVVDHPREGEKIRRHGFQFCQTFHSVKERMKMVIDVFDGKEINTDYRRFLDMKPGT